MYGINEANEIFGGLMWDKPDRDRSIFEQAADAGSVDDFANKQVRAQAMACALAWIANGDYSYGALDESLSVIADLDGDEELSDDEDDYLNEMFNEIASAFVALGADVDNVQTFIDNEDDDEGMKLGSFLSEKMQGIEKDDETIISDYAVSDAPILEGLVKAVRGGRIVLKRKKLKGKRPRRKLSTAQRMGLKMARKKAFTGAAKRVRAKSMRLRKKMGL